MSVVLQVFEAT